MPTGPQGQKRPVSTNAAAVMIGRIATRQIPEQYVEETERGLRPAAQEVEKPS